MDPAGLDVAGGEALRRQRAEELANIEANGGRNSGASMRPVMDLVDPAPGPAVDLVDAVGHARDEDLLEERLLQITKRPLDLALRFAPPARHALTSTPRCRADSSVGGYSPNRRPWDCPSAPIRSVRATSAHPWRPAQRHASLLHDIRWTDLFTGTQAPAILQGHRPSA